ncbi:MAG: hypothetical protein JKY49_00065 [Cohaesibacteraceae bacterium]|nr:hypothetical protein [Cohaesibacteraceae bacterium]MBL4875998.1 hypothetical protein [Cohaesibacteraceae bacterium]
MVIPLRLKVVLPIFATVIMVSIVSIVFFTGPEVKQIIFKTGTYVGQVLKQEGRSPVPHGTGVFVWNSGDKQSFRGVFVDGRIKGPGQVLYHDGVTCSGEFDAGVNINSDAVCTSGDGSRYEGYMEKGLRHKTGTMYYSNGDKYLGNWNNGQQHGQGKMYYANGSTYHGDWIDGKPHGQYGVLDVPNGKHGAVRFVGQFVDGNMQGRGRIEFYKEYRTYCVFMENGHLVSKRRNEGVLENCG